MKQAANAINKKKLCSEQKKKKRAVRAELDSHEVSAVGRWSLIVLACTCAFSTSTSLHTVVGARHTHTRVHT